LTKRDDEDVVVSVSKSPATAELVSTPDVETAAIPLDKSRFKTLIPNHLLNPVKLAHLDESSSPQNDDLSIDIRTPQERDLKQQQQQTSLSVGDMVVSSSSSAPESTIQEAISSEAVTPTEVTDTTPSVDGTAAKVVPSPLVEPIPAPAPAPAIGAVESSTAEGATTPPPSPPAGPLFIDPISLVLMHRPLAGAPPTPPQPDEANILFRNTLSSSTTPSTSTSNNFIIPGFNLAGMYWTLFIASQLFLVFLLVTLFLGVLILTEFVLDREDEDYAQLQYLYWGRVFGIAVATIVSAIHGSLLTGYVIIDGHSDWIAKAAVGAICIYWVSMTWIMNKMTGPLPY
jgi:uncharacterized integral membrane protein